MRIEFTVMGLPPKKHGEQSMFSQKQPNEATRVVLLREAALAARQRACLSTCIQTRCQLELTIYASDIELERMGDLDNFITGVCDGLQAAKAAVWPHLHESFLLSEREAIHPRYPLLIANDAKILTIIARKRMIPPGQEVSYHVAIDTDVS